MLSQKSEPIDNKWGSCNRQTQLLMLHKERQ